MPGNREFNKQKFYRPGLTEEPEYQVNQIQDTRTPLSGANVGDNLSFVVQLIDIPDPPDPLFLFVNPRNFEVKSTKAITNSFTRQGYVCEFWGDDTDTITASGTTGGTYTKEAGLWGGPQGNCTFGKAGPDNANAGIDGRLSSAAYQQLRALLIFYKNNGRVYMGGNSVASTALVPFAGTVATIPTSFTMSERNKIVTVGLVAIIYDGVVYYGHFDSFQFTDSASTPHTFNYSFSFTVLASDSSGTDTVTNPPTGLSNKAVF